LQRRVVVTGIGLVCAVGNTAPEAWKNLVAGKSGVAPITQFDTTGFPVTFAAEVKDFDPLKFVDKKESRKMARFIHLALGATEEALQSAGLKIDQSNADRSGVFIGSGIGGFEVIEREHSNLINGGPRKISPFFIPAAIVNMAAGHVSIKYGAKGPISATATACTTSANAIGDAARIIQHGDADIMIAGGSEAAVTPMSVGGFAAMRALSTRNDAPEKASRPWDKDRDGFVLGEGAGVVVLEEYEHAKRRGARIYAELAGYGMSADAFHMTAPPEDGNGAARCMANAIRNSAINADQIDYINAHGTSTPLGDVAETVAVKRCFGDHAKKLAVSSTKSMTGHLLGAAGGVEAVFSALAVKEQVAPPTANLFNQDPACDLDYVPNSARSMPIRAALSNSFGFGGTNGTLIFTRV